MRVRVGRVVNLDKDVNLGDLSPLDRIIASATNAYRNTSFYKRRFAESQERRDEQLRKVKEALGNNLLSIITQQLKNNQLLEGKEDTCVGILLEVPARFSPYLQEVITMQEFMPYNMIIIPANPTVRKFADPPVLLYIENKGIT